MSRSKDLIHCQQRGAMCRRDFLRLGTGVAATLGLSPVFARTNTPSERSLSLLNTHTDESLATTYWADGEYIQGAVEEINFILRDHRSGETYSMDEQLIDLLYVLQSQTGSKGSFHIISGYRSPATNSMLNKKSSGVAKRSYHMQGKAIDVRLPGCDLKNLHAAALSLKAGGVGYYPSSDFIHVDVGPVRRW
jgi:uncharacterized protein YcbK (DUF882 family)